MHLGHVLSDRVGEQSVHGGGRAALADQGLLSQQLEIFLREPLLSRPGSSWRYSSPGYVLLGWIVQQVSGQPYADFLADRIFAPWA